MRKRRITYGVLAVLALVIVARVLTIEPRPAKAYLGDARPVVLAHQGASFYAPSNTLESFRLGMKQGADIIETDVHMTKDGVIVVSHDETIDRMSNGSGLIKNMTLAELRTYDFGYDFTMDGGKTFPYRGLGVTIPTLEEVFREFPGVRVNIELKQTDPPSEGKVWAVVRQYHMEEKVLINSFMAEPTEAWKKVAGETVALGGNKSDMYTFAAYWLPRLDWLYNPKVDAFQLPVSQKVGGVEIRLDTPRLIERAHKVGVKVHYWTINDEPTMRHLVEIGADGIITDRPDLAVKVLKEMNKR